VLCISLLALLVAAAVGYAVARSITVPTSQAVAVALRVAARDLSGTVVAGTNDEAAQLLKALHGMTKSLVTVVSSVRSAQRELGGRRWADRDGATQLVQQDGTPGRQRSADGLVRA